MIIWDRTQELTRVTVEVNSNRTVVQIRGLQNRPPVDDETELLRQWTGENGLILRN